MPLQPGSKGFLESPLQTLQIDLGLLTEMVTLLSKFERLVVDLSRAPRGQTRDSL